MTEKSGAAGAVPSVECKTDMRSVSAGGGFSEDRRAAGPVGDGGLGAALSAMGSRSGSSGLGVSQRSL